MKGYNFTFLDVETTGLSYRSDRIIEVGAVRVENGIIVATYNQLINPERRVNRFITNLTGITQRQVEIAPKFNEIAASLEVFIQNSVLVAHNASFDMGFLRAEFARLGEDFSTPNLCSARVSRNLFPEYRRHSLSTLISRYKIEIKDRHRALEDARAIFEFFKTAVAMVGERQFNESLHLIKDLNPEAQKSAPSRLPDIPKGPGVYMFMDHNDHPLYIGKSINVYKRVRSHQMQKTGSIFAQKYARLDIIKTAGELGALLREALLIKHRYPSYNRQLRQNRGLGILRREIDKNGYINLKYSEIPRIDVSDLDKFFGVFRSRKQLEGILTNLVRNYSLCNKLVGLERTSSSCFANQLGYCKGACAHEEQPESYNERLLKAFSDFTVADWFYSGPIVVTEKCGRVKEQFLIDKWCLLASTKDLGVKLPKPYHFEMDIYKIICRFLRKKKNKFELEQLSSLTDAIQRFKLKLQD